MKKTFEQYDSENPHIWQSFIHFCVQTRAKGFIRYSAKGIAELIRWHTSERGKEPFKIDNNFTADYARKMENTYPEFKDFFEKRTLKKLIR
jgi:hypothetical protein